MEAYVPRSQNAVYQFITTLPILGLYEELVWMPGACEAKKWWEQEVFDLGGPRTTAVAAN